MSVPACCRGPPRPARKIFFTEKYIVTLEYGDFHQLSHADAGFDQYWSQEAFLHAVDKAQVLSEAYRVIKPGGHLVFTDILVRGHTPDEIRERVYERVNAPEMWDAPGYRQALENLVFDIKIEEDWSSNVAPTYAWVRGQLEKRVREHFDLRPYGIINMLDLLQPIYTQTSAYGRFGRDDVDLSWERTDRAEALRSDAPLAATA